MEKFINNAMNAKLSQRQNGPMGNIGTLSQ
jgi:hypothetical protein